MSDLSIWQYIVAGIVIFLGIPVLCEMCARAIIAGKLRAQREHFEKLKKTEENLYGKEEKTSKHGRENESKS